MDSPHMHFLHLKKVSLPIKGALRCWVERDTLPGHEKGGTCLYCGSRFPNHLNCLLKPLEHLHLGGLIFSQ